MNTNVFVMISPLRTIANSETRGCLGFIGCVNRIVKVVGRYSYHSKGEL